MRACLLCLFLFLAQVSFPWGALAQTPPLPKNLPAYGPLVPFHAPHVIAHKLSNGLTVWLVPRPGFPKVTFVVAVRGGWAADPRTLPGLSNLLLGAIDQGTKTRTAREIADEFQAAGGDLTGQPRSDSDVLSVSVLASRAEGALAVLSDVLQNATFPESQVALAKRNEEQSLEAREADPSFLAQRAFAHAFFGGHPYSVIAPTSAALEQATAADVRAQYQKEFRPDGTVLVGVGDFQAAELASLIERQFGGWKMPADPPIQPAPPPPRDNPHAAFILARPHSVQSTLLLGAFGPNERDPDYAAAEVANAIYGGMFGSRLITDIREEKGYTYSPRAALETRLAAATLETTVSARNAVTGACLNEILYQLNRMATTAPTEQEVQQARRYLIGTRAIAYQLQAAVAHRLASLWVRGLPPEQIQTESDELQKVTPQEVEAAGAKYFPAARMTIVAVGDEKLIGEQLGRFGIALRAMEGGK